MRADVCVRVFDRGSAVEALDELAADAEAFGFFDT